MTQHTKFFLSIGGALLTTFALAQTIPTAPSSDKQSFVDALAEYWGKPNTSQDASPPPPSKGSLQTTFLANPGAQKEAQRTYNIMQSFISFTGANNNHSELDIFNASNPTNNTLALYRCLTANAMPNNPVDPTTIKSTTDMESAGRVAIDSVDYTLRFAPPQSCSASTLLSDDAAQNASAYRGVMFFHAAVTQCLNSFGDQNDTTSAKPKAPNNPMSGNAPQGKFAKNLQPCTKFDAYQLGRRMKATLIDGRRGEGALPSQLQSTVNALISGLPQPTKDSSPNLYKSFLTNVQGQLNGLSDKLSNALLLSLNKNANTANMQPTQPFMLSASGLVNQNSLNMRQASDAGNWLQGIAASFSPQHYVAPGLIIADPSSGTFAFGRGHLLNLTTINTMSSKKQKGFYRHSRDDSKHYVSPSTIMNFRTNQIGEINKQIQSYTTKIAQFGLLKNAALGSLSMLIAERVNGDNKKPSFIAALKANATARSGDTYPDTLAQLKPVGLMREEVKLLADIRYQLYLNYLAQERVQASLAMVQLNNLHDAAGNLDSQYKQLKDKIKQYNKGEKSSGINPSAMQANPSMPGA